MPATMATAAEILIQVGPITAALIAVEALTPEAMDIVAGTALVAAATILLRAGDITVRQVVALAESTPVALVVVTEVALVEASMVEVEADFTAAAVRVDKS
jgi:hypothetical protein